MSVRPAALRTALSEHDSAVARFAQVLTALLLTGIAGCANGSGSPMPIMLDPLPESDWVELHDFGRWELAQDRQTILLERPGVGNNCRTSNRAILVEEEAATWLVQLEHKTGGASCPVECRTDSIFPCPVEVAIGRLLPDGVQLRIACDPNRSPFNPGAEVRPTLAPMQDGTEPVICSSSPDSAS